MGGVNSGRRTANPSRRTVYRQQDRLARVRASTVRGVPAMPRDLCPQGQALWRSIVAKLDQAGVLSAIDGPVIESACRTWVLYFQALKVCSENPKDMNACQSLLVYGRCHAAWMTKLGLPVDRPSVWAEAVAQEADSLDEFLAMRPC